MAPLTPSDVKRWDPDAIHQVFQTASNRAQTLTKLGDNLQQVHNGLSDWQGEAGDAFRADLGHTRRDIEADGQESRQVAAAVSAAEADVRACRSELDNIQQMADANHWAITPDWRIDPGNTLKGPNGGMLAIELQTAQSALDALKLHAHTTDHELATAVRSAVGEAPTSARPPAPGGSQPQPKPQAEQPKSWKDMLTPAGSGNGAGAGQPVPADAGSGKPPSLEDMLLGRGEPAGQKPPPGSLPDLLSRMPKPGGTPAPKLNPADIESFKAMARQSMLADGVPPDQIEGRLNDIVGRTQQWMDRGMPNYVPPAPPKPPPPGFGDGFADHWFGFEDTVHRLTGQEGLDAMGDAWGGMAKGLAGKAEESLLMGPVAPVNDLTHEFKSFLDNPAYYAGGKTADGAIALPGMMFGGEGAAVEAGLGDIGPGVLDTGPAVSTHAPIGFEHPVEYNPLGPDSAFDLNYAHWNGGPTGALSEPVADMSTHYIGDNPDRVVLGKFDTHEGGYIGEARSNGGIYFDTGDPTWDALTQGFAPKEEQSLVWQVNEHFLRNQMESEVPRIEYVLPDGFNSVEQLAGAQRQSYSAMEINFLKENAAAYGYEQQGNVWVYRGGK
ncbi:hypothetical protein GCM10009641_02020 [Mycobacterium cookii]|uniref:Uncharacterized protein n=1 Tax=Mycobacterium cookii TaxID=1775 RepID=A0A7I7L577_9MYCO|nr:hypothetical protein [Mycobacterium cookii]MCV7329416.1 hypothetical protein [Mycobacterium cookii]BBX48752.1 hypothetical protein MCOO_47670 [Mycobacterium cookii]